MVTQQAFSGVAARQILSAGRVTKLAVMVYAVGLSITAIQAPILVNLGIAMRISCDASWTRVRDCRSCAKFAVCFNGNRNRRCWFSTPAATVAFLGGFKDEKIIFPSFFFSGF